MPRGDGTGPPQGTGGGRGQMSGRQGRMGGPHLKPVRMDSVCVRVVVIRHRMR